MLLTTQYLDEADRLADRIAVIDHGVVIAEGTAAELKAHTGGEWLEVRLGDADQASAALASLEPLAAEEITVDEATLRVPVRRRQGARRGGGAAPRQRRCRGRRSRRLEPDAERRVPDLTGHAAEEEETGWTALRYAVSDTLVLAWRNLLRIPRQPDLLLGFTVQPVMFVLLFVYVFGGAISTPGSRYVDFLIPGIMVQSMVFGGFVTALGLAEDLRKGLIDRFRSLPMSRAAVLTGRTLADVVTNVIQIAVMLAVGYAVGFRFATSAPRVVAGVGLLLFIGYAFSWVFALIGLTASSPEASNAYGFTILFPVTFVSSAFVPVKSMPGWLQPVANNNPFTTWSTRLAPCSSERRPATRSGSPRSGRPRSSPCSACSPSGATGTRSAGSGPLTGRSRVTDDRRRMRAAARLGVHASSANAATRSFTVKRP